MSDFISNYIDRIPEAKVASDTAHNRQEASDETLQNLSRIVTKAADLEIWPVVYDWAVEDSGLND